MNPAPPAPPTPQPLHDDGLEWLRDIRRHLTASFDHHQKAIGDYLRRREAELGDRIVRTQPRIVSAKP